LKAHLILSARRFTLFAPFFLYCGLQAFERCRLLKYSQDVPLSGKRLVISLSVPVHVTQPAVASCACS